MQRNLYLILTQTYISKTKPIKFVECCSGKEKHNTINTLKFYINSLLSIAYFIAATI
jgi:hypothetical protein